MWDGPFPRDLWKPSGGDGWRIGSQAISAREPPVLRPAVPAGTSGCRQPRNEGDMNNFYRACVIAVAIVATVLFACRGLARAQANAGVPIGAPAQEGVGRVQQEYQARPLPTPRQPNPLMPMQRELAMKIKGPFTLTAVGDLILRTPIAPLAEPGFQNLIKHIRDADVGFANMEGPLIDQDNYPYSIGGAGFGGAPKSALATIKSMGVKIMGTANNMQMDADITGMLETIRMLN